MVGRQAFPFGIPSFVGAIIVFGGVLFNWLEASMVFQFSSCKLLQIDPKKAMKKLFERGDSEFRNQSVCPGSMSVFRGIYSIYSVGWLYMVVFFELLLKSLGFKSAYIHYNYPEGFA